VIERSSRSSSRPPEPENSSRAQARRSSGADVAESGAENADLAADLRARTAALDAEVAARRRVEAELRSSQERIDRALAIARMGIWELDFESGRLTWSDTMRQVFGLPADAVPETLDKAYDAVHPEDRPMVTAAMEKSMADGSEFACVFRTLWPDGTSHWVDGRARIFADALGRPARALGVSFDVDDRKLLEDQFHQAQKLEAVGQLAGGLAHDFNNRLTAILGYANLVIAGLPEGDGRRGDMDEIVHAAQSAAALTRQLLALGRRQVVQPTVVDLNRIVSETAQMLGRLLDERIRIVTLLAPQVPPVRADPSQIEQVLMNLAVNARDAMPEGGRLVIQTEAVEVKESYARQPVGVSAGCYVRLTVSDTGVGMTDEVRRHIFEPFFTTKERGKGTGLGLATVYSMVRQSGGHIFVHSEPNRGTAFKVYLPAAEGARTEHDAAPINAAPVGTETVLVVEDDRAVRYLVQTLLTHAGYRVFEATDSASAEAVLAAHDGPIDLLISDVIMPGANGPELYARARLVRPDLKVLFMSGYADAAIGRDGVLAPDVAFLQKPFTAEALARKVRDVLDQ
jgi:signal transduction histidine kinase